MVEGWEGFGHGREKGAVPLDRRREDKWPLDRVEDSAQRRDILGIYNTWRSSQFGKFPRKEARDHPRNISHLGSLSYDHLF